MPSLFPSGIDQGGNDDSVVLKEKVEGYREHVSNDLVPRPEQLLEFTVHPSFQPISLRSLGQDTTSSQLR